MCDKSLYDSFLINLDKKISKYNDLHKDFICCRKGCSHCCEKGDYPISEVELEYLMLGYSKLNYDMRIKIQDNIKILEKGGACPFLLENCCAVYKYRPIICRTHGLAYLNKNNVVVVPYCTSEGKNYATLYSKGIFSGEPIRENLSTDFLLKDFRADKNFIIKPLSDWIKVDAEKVEK